jgi:hypothetical protein
MKMNRQYLLNKGIDNDLIGDAEFGIDEISSSGFDSIEDFLFDWCWYHESPEGYGRKDVKYYIMNGENKRIRVLVWLEN